MCLISPVRVRETVLEEQGCEEEKLTQLMNEKGNSKQREQLTQNYSSKRLWHIWELEAVQGCFGEQRNGKMKLEKKRGGGQMTNGFILQAKEFGFTQSNGESL